MSAKSAHNRSPLAAAPTPLLLASGRSLPTSSPIIPVLDVAANRLVRAVAGDRASYAPWRSKLAPTADPREFVANFAGQGKPLTIYAADLDALAGGEPNWPLWERLAGEHSLWCDAGIAAAEDLRRLAALVAPRVGRAVLATEAAQSAAHLVQTARLAGAVTAVSFDWRGERPISRGNWLAASDWLDLARELRRSGVRAFVVVDVAAVGANGGPTVGDRCRALRRVVPDADIVAGGGVRDMADVERLIEAGCDGVLVASAIHAGTIVLGGNSRPNSPPRSPSAQTPDFSA